MPRSFSVKNFGCRATQADGAGIAAELSARGLSCVDDPALADLVVVNTCTVTAEADRDARKSIRRVHRENPSAEILVTGCYAQRSPGELLAMEGVKWTVGNSHKHEIGALVAPSLVQIGNASRHPVSYHGEIEQGGTLVGDISKQVKLHTLPAAAPQSRSRPNVKVQDGCDNRCSFCIIPSVRGRSRSSPVDAVVREVKELDGGYPEIVLTGINLGRWGRDLEGRPRLAGLLAALLSRTAVRRIRLSSVEPMDWTADLLELMASSPRIAKHVHIPLQSGSDTVLRRMRRRYRVTHYERRLAMAREAMPTASIGADVMVGFPGESDEEFEETRAFVERMPFTYLHVFSYSSRQGTEAAGLAAQIPKSTKKRRNRVLRTLIARKNLSFRKGLLGTCVDAVTLSSGTSGTRALSDNFIDISIPGSKVEPRRQVLVRLVSIEGNRTTGQLVT